MKKCIVLFSILIGLLSFTGFAQKQDTSKYLWVKQKQQTKKFRFEVSGTDDDNYSMSRGSVDALKIINKKTGAVQLLTHIYCEIEGSIDNDVVQVKDCNFDGYLDLMIYAHGGGAGPNYGYNFYLYNPQTEQFEYHKKLSDLSQVEVDSKTKTISSNWRASAGDHGGETYTFMADTLTEISGWTSHWFPTGFIVNNSGKLVHNQWKDSISFGTVIQDDSVPVFAKPNPHASTSGVLVKNNRLIICQETPLWFYVEDENDQSISGWLKKTQLLPKEDLPYSAETKDYRFVAMTKDSTIVVGIKVIDKAMNKVIQIIPKYRGFEFSDDSFQVEEKNKGHLAFHIKNTHFGASEYYQFDKKKDLFEIDLDKKEKKVIK